MRCSAMSLQGTGHYRDTGMKRTKARRKVPLQENFGNSWFFTSQGWCFFTKLQEKFEDDIKKKAEYYVNLHMRKA